MEAITNLLGDLALTGILARSDLEVVVIDNNPSPSPALHALVVGSGAVYAHQSRRGQAAALNKGIEVAAGALVGFIDDDIRVSNSLWLERLASHFSDPSVGYASGNVLAHTLGTPAQRIWETRGGLSKGSRARRFTQAEFWRFSFRGTPLRYIAVGANAMVPRTILTGVCGFDERFGVGSKVGHSQSFELCYKIFRAGYEAVYDPSAIVTHQHPETMGALRRRMFRYGIGDSAVHLHFFLTYGDIRGLSEALGARHLHLMRNMVRRIFRRYPMPVSTILSSLAGASLGPLYYGWASFDSVTAKFRAKE